MAIILFGYYGFDNIGDETLLDETVKLLQDIKISSQFVVASGPCSIPFETFNRWNIFAWFFRLKKAPVLVFGGGSLFQSRTSFFSLLFYLFIVQLALFFRCKVLILCHGWGPFKYAYHERIAYKILSQPGIQRSWRDEMARAMFSNLHDPVFTDLAFFQKRHTSSQIKMDSPLFLAASLIDMSLNKQIAKVVASFDSIKLCSLINQPGIQDAQPDPRLLTDVWDDPTTNIQLLITQRYHTAIWASKFGIPWLAVSDDPKLIALAESANQAIISFSDPQLEGLIINFIKETPVGYPDSKLLEWYDSFFCQRLRTKEWLIEQLSS